MQTIFPFENKQFRALVSIDSYHYFAGKKGFFEDAYKNMMDVFHNEEEREKENNNIVESEENAEGDKYVEVSQ